MESSIILGCVIPGSFPWKTGILNPNQKLIPKSKPALMIGNCRQNKALLIPLSRSFVLVGYSHFSLHGMQIFQGLRSPKCEFFTSVRHLVPQNSQSHFLMLQEKPQSFLGILEFSPHGLTFSVSLKCF